jgi:hypothetical protein
MVSAQDKPSCILATDEFVDKPAIGRQVSKVARTTQKQRIRNSPLQMTVRAFNGAILTGDTKIIACRFHAVMGSQRLITLRQVFARFAGEIAEYCRQTVSTRAIA